MINKLFGKCKVQIHLWYLLFSVLFSAMIIVSRHIFYQTNGNSTVDTTYVTDFHILDFVGIILLTPIVYYVVKAIVLCFSAVSDIFCGNIRKHNVLVFIGFLAFIFIPWIPYFFAYWPGGIYSDTVSSINMALGKAQWDNHNPILYTLIWRFAFWITGGLKGEGEYDGLNLFTVGQTFVLAFALASFVYYCYRKGLHKHFVSVLLFLFAIYPLYPFYGISMWKDTFFSIAVFMFSVFLFEIFSENPDKISTGQLIGYGIGSLLIIFLRNNGLYIVAFYSVVIVLMCIRKHREIAYKIGAVSLVLLVISWIVQGPVFDKAGFNIDRAAESFGVPIQQTAYILATDGNVGDDELEVLNEIMPLENWEALYNPVVVDTIKFDPSFNKEYFEENTNEFVKVYISLVMKNPVKAVKAYLLETMGFWNVFENSSTAYICNFHFGNAEYYMSDYFDYFFGFSFRNFVEPKNYISSAVFVWIMIATVSICLAKRYYLGILPILPTVGLWLSIMVATPVAFSFRYVYAIFLCVPLYIVICIKAVRKEQESMK